jgi:hypothetical protein
MFTKTIEMRLFRQMGLDVDIFALEDQSFASSIEQYFSSIGTRYRERKRLGLEIELKLRVFGRAPLTKPWTWEDAIGNLS